MSSPAPYTQQRVAAYPPSSRAERRARRPPRREHWRRWRLVRPRSRFALFQSSRSSLCRGALSCLSCGWRSLAVARCDRAGFKVERAHRVMSPCTKSHGTRHCRASSAAVRNQAGVAPGPARQDDSCLAIGRAVKLEATTTTDPRAEPRGGSTTRIDASTRGFPRGEERPAGRPAQPPNSNHM